MIHVRGACTQFGVPNRTSTTDWRLRSVEPEAITWDRPIVPMLLDHTSVPGSRSIGWWFPPLVDGDLARVEGVVTRHAWMLLERRGRWALSTEGPMDFKGNRITHMRVTALAIVRGSGCDPAAEITSWRRIDPTDPEWRPTAADVDVIARLRAALSSLNTAEVAEEAVA